MKHTITILIMISGLTTYGQSNNFFNQQLIDSILVDTVVSDNWYKDKIYNLVDMINNDKGQTDKMFPFSHYDSVIAYRFNEKYKSTENSKYLDKVFVNGEICKDLKISNGYKLTDKQTQKLLDLINNPLNFHWGECGTPIPYGLIIFYKKQQIIGLIQLSCGYRQIDCYPKNLRIKLGGLRDDKTELIIKLVKEIQIE